MPVCEEPRLLRTGDWVRPLTAAMLKQAMDDAIALRDKRYYKFNEDRGLRPDEVETLREQFLDWIYSTQLARIADLHGWELEDWRADLEAALNGG